MAFGSLRGLALGILWVLGVSLELEVLLLGALFGLLSGIEQLVNPGLIETGNLPGHFAHRAACFVGELRDFRRVVITDDRRKGSTHCQALFDIALAFGGVGLQAHNTPP